MNNSVFPDWLSFIGHWHVHFALQDTSLLGHARMSFPDAVLLGQVALIRVGHGLTPASGCNSGGLQQVISWSYTGIVRITGGCDLFAATMSSRYEGFVVARDGLVNT